MNFDKGITKYLNRVYCLIDFLKIGIYQKLWPCDSRIVSSGPHNFKARTMDVSSLKGP